MSTIEYKTRVFRSFEGVHDVTIAYAELQPNSLYNALEQNSMPDNLNLTFDFADGGAWVAKYISPLVSGGVGQPTIFDNLMALASETPEETGGFDLTKLFGRKCRITVEKNAKGYDTLKKLEPIPAGEVDVTPPKFKPSGTLVDELKSEPEKDSDLDAIFNS